MVITAITAASTRNTARQSMWAARAAVIGAKIVLASPPANVSRVKASTRRAPAQRVSAANAGGYSTALIAIPASSHAAVNHSRLGASATPTTARAAVADPRDINHRGPCRSIHRPTTIPTRPDTTSPAENAPASVGGDQPVSAAIRPDSTGNA